MARAVFTPGRDLSMPLVEIDPDASGAEKAGLWALRVYLAVAMAVGLASILLFVLAIFLPG